MLRDVIDVTTKKCQDYIYVKGEYRISIALNNGTSWDLVAV